jgi:hypothetical protein
LSIRPSRRSRAAVIVCRRCSRSDSAAAIWFLKTRFRHATDESARLPVRSWLQGFRVRHSWREL